MTGNNILETLVDKLPASFSYDSPGFRAVLECMLDVEPRTTTPSVEHVAIRRTGTVVGYTDGQWYEMMEEWADGFTILTKRRLTELILNLCYDANMEPKERFFLMECINAMEHDGVDV